MSQENARALHLNLLSHFGHSHISLAFPSFCLFCYRTGDHGFLQPSFASSRNVLQVLSISDSLRIGLRLGQCASESWLSRPPNS